MMKRLFAALAAAALVVTPISAMAQGHGGMGGGRGGFGGAHGFAVGGGGHFHGGGFRGRGCCRGVFPFLGGFAPGGPSASPWYYWGDAWDDWGPGPYPYGYYGYGGYYGPPPPPYGAPPAGATAAGACGRGVWRPDGSAAPRAPP